MGQEVNPAMSVHINYDATMCLHRAKQLSFNAINHVVNV